jgi:hypothetical protein
MPPTPPLAPPRLRFLLLIIFASACSSSPITSIPIATFNNHLFLNLTDCPLSLRAHQPSVAAADAFFARLAGGNSTYAAPSSSDHFSSKFGPHFPRPSLHPFSHPACLQMSRRGGRWLRCFDTGTCAFIRSNFDIRGNSNLRRSLCSSGVVRRRSKQHHHAAPLSSQPCAFPFSFS